MNINNAEYITIDAHPYLRLVIDDKEALIGELKWSIRELGYVPLTCRDFKVDWSEILPTIHVPATQTRREFTLKGFTDDPIIVKMAHAYWKAVNHLDGEKFEKGPVPIPTEG